MRGFDLAPLFAEALGHHQAGRLADAERLYRHILGLDPGHADSLNLLGVLAHQIGRPQDGAELIARAVRINPMAELYRNNLGCALEATGRLDEAAKAFAKAVEIKADYADAHYNLGNVLQAARRHEEARAAYRQALVLRPDHAEAHNNAGSNLHALGHIDEATSAFEKAVALKPDYARAFYNLGNAHVASGRRVAAIEAYSAAIKREPRDAEAHNNLGHVLREAGQLDEAFAAMNAAVKLKPDNAQAHNNIGGLLRDMHRASEAASAFRTAIKLAPDYADALCNLGAVLGDLGEREEAIEALRKAVALDHRIAPHLLAALEGRNTDRAPREYVTDFFDGFAANFENHLTKTLAYRAPEILRTMVGGTDPGRRFQHLADLGCGTGLTGLAFRDVAAAMTGVDLAPKMVAQADEKKIYDHLLTGDIVEALLESRTRFDLFVLADVLIYFGSIDALFDAVRARALPNARLAFSVEIAEGEGFQLLPSGRYAHSRSYLERELARIDADILAWETHALRIEKGVPCEGYYVVAGLKGVPTA